ncbi:MAG TPA: hypothetical protein VM120_25285 [Bryobacteraceae bacterium]|nr:hypothetical protein [Bryobacteraceae bacterium]
MSASTYEEIVDFIAGGTTPQSVIAFRPSSAVQQRVEDLVARSKDDSISSDELSELDDYLQLEHILLMVKARAHQYSHVAG